MMHGRGGNAGQGRIGDRRPLRGPRIVEPLGQLVDDEAGAEMEERRGDTDGRRVVAEERRGSGNQPRDQRRLRVVAEGRMKRPDPVLRLVGIEVGAVEHEPGAPHQGNHEDDEERDLPGAIVGGRVRRVILSLRTVMAAEPSGGPPSSPPSFGSPPGTHTGNRRPSLLSQAHGPHMPLRIETFSNSRGGNAFFKAVTHPLAARAMPSLLDRLRRGQGRALRSRRVAPTAWPTFTTSPRSTSPAATSRT